MFYKLNVQQGGGRAAGNIIRSIGAGAEARSLVIGIFLAGIREIAVGDAHRLRLLPRLQPD